MERNNSRYNNKINNFKTEKNREKLKKPTAGLRKEQ